MIQTEENGNLMMRILILNWRDIKNPASGGAEILTYEMAKCWARWGHKVTQFSSVFDGCSKRELIDGIEIIRAGHPDARYLFTSVHFLAFLYYQKHGKGRFDVVIDEIHGLPFFTPFYIKGKKVALICEVAGELWKKMYGPFFGSIGRGLEKFYLNSLYKNVSFLTISESTKQELAKEGIATHNITVLPMGISVPKKLNSVEKEKDPTLIFVGRLTKSKGVEDAIKAFKRIVGSTPKAKLWIVGRGSNFYISFLKKLAQELNLAKKIEFFGYVSDSKKFELMRSAHILVHPSIKEGWGLTIPEAGIVGTPSIAYNSPGLRDILQGNKLGIITKTNSPHSLSNAIIYLLKDRERYNSLVKKLSDFKDNIGWEKTAKVALSIMEENIR